MNYFITGGAGFVGSHFVDKLIAKKHNVTVYDNLILGKKDNIKKHFNVSKFTFIKGDILSLRKLTKSMSGADVVIHLAANSDIIKSSKDPNVDLKNGTIGTYNILEAMRKNKIKKIIFTSSSVIYGEVKKLPINENLGPLFPISFYGASKLASEALISAYCHNYNFQSWIFRFGNVIGPKVTHGVVMDFYNKLKINNKKLTILGDGNQQKPYILVDDIVDGILFALNKAKKKVNYFNLGTKGSTKVKKITKEVLKYMNLKKVKIIYSGGKRGWPGDVTKVRLDNSKIKKLGYKFFVPDSTTACKLGVKQIIDYLEKNRR
jgi:UDP-glucose 4-epimerase